MEVKKIVEGMTAVEVAEVIDSNFKNQNKILEEDIAKQNNVIGVSEYKDFSEAEAVNVGDVRKYNGLLYECVEATTGAFDASKWKKSSFKAETEKKLSELGSEVRDSSIFELGTIDTSGILVEKADGTRIRTKEFVMAKNEDVVYFNIDKGITVSNINVLLYNDGDFVSYEGGAIESKNGSFSQKLKFDNRVFNQIKVVVACYMATDEKANASQVETPIRNKELKDSIEKNGLAILALSDEIKKSNQQISSNRLNTEGVKSDLNLFKKEFGEHSSFELGTIDTSGILVEKADGTRIRTKDYVKVKSGDILKVSLGIDVTTLNFVLYNDGDFVKYSPKPNPLSKGIYEFEVDDDGVYNQIKIVCSCCEATNEIALSSWAARMVYTPELEKRIDENEKKLDYIDAKSSSYVIDNGVLFDFNFSRISKKPSVFEDNSDWVLSEGHLVNYGGSALWTNKSITINEKETCIVFNLRNDAEVALAWKSNNWRATGSYMSVTKDLLAIYNCSQEGVKTSVNVSKEIGISLYKDYILKATKNLHENILSLYDGVSGVKIAEISTNQTSTVVENEEFPGGRQMDVLGIQVPSGNAFIKRLNVVSKIKNPLVYIYGDSITEGDRCYDNDTYGYLLKEAIGKDKVALSGQSGSKIYNDGIGGVYDRIVNEITPLIFRPKYIMVTIGTNGGVSQENFNNLKSLIEALGCIPIINVPPIRDYVTEVTREYVLNLNCRSCRFDIATALNYDITQGRNDALFADGAHPNKYGQLAMFERIKVDVPELFF